MIHWLEHLKEMKAKLMKYFSKMTLHKGSSEKERNKILVGGEAKWIIFFTFIHVTAISYSLKRLCHQSCFLPRILAIFANVWCVFMFILLIRPFRFFLGNLEPKPIWSTGQVNICVELSKSFWFSDICFCLEAESEKPQSAKTKQHNAEPKIKSFQPYLAKKWTIILCLT